MEVNLSTFIDYRGNFAGDGGNFGHSAKFDEKGSATSGSGYGGSRGSYEGGDGSFLITVAQKAVILLDRTQCGGRRGYDGYNEKRNVTGGNYSDGNRNDFVNYNG